MSKYQPILDLHNAKLHPLLVNVHNYEVLSVSPYNGTGGINTIVELRVDRSIDQDGNTVEGYDVEEDRYFTRSVEVQRFDLNAVITEEIKAVLRDVVTGLVISPQSLATDEEVLSVVTNGAVQAVIKLSPDDIKLVRIRPVNAAPYYVMVAKDDSTSFIGKVVLSTDGAVIPEPEPEPEVLPWATSTDVEVVSAASTENFNPILAAKYGETVRIHTPMAVTQKMRMLAHFEHVTGNAGVEVVLDPNDLYHELTIPAFVNNGPAKSTITFTDNEGQELSSSIVLFLMNATVDESTLALGEVSTTIFDNLVYGTTYLDATTFASASVVNVLRADGTALSEGDSNTPFARTLDINNTSGDWGIKFSPNGIYVNGDYGFTVRKEIGWTLSNPTAFEYTPVANQGMPTAKQADVISGTIYTRPNVWVFQLKNPADGTWVSGVAAGTEGVEMMAYQTEIDLRMLVEPAGWSPVSGHYFNLVSATGEPDITIDQDAGKILFGSPSGGTANIELIIDAGVEHTAPLPGGGFGPALNQTYNIKITRNNVLEQS